MTKGVLLIAIGHDSYKRMAHALACSIRVNDPEMKVTVATDQPVPEDMKFLYDKVKIVPESMYVISGKKHFIRAKLCAYDLSPYQETLFLDVDQVMIPRRSIASIFDSLTGVEFTMANTGLAGSSVWVDIEEAKKLYGKKPFWNYHSELIYFKKSDAVKAYFKKAKEIYDKADIKSAFQFAGGRMADELAFQVASMITGVYPHQENWTPNFWYVRHPKLTGKFPYQLEGFVTYSIGGASIPPYVRINYNKLAAFYFTRLKLQNPYKAKDKRSFLTERSKL